MKKWNISLVVLAIISILVSIYNIIFDIFVLMMICKLPLNTRISSILTSLLVIVVSLMALYDTLKEKKGGRS